MDIMQLRYFYELACGYTMNQAAENLHVSQSALSMSIRKLEEELKTDLFDRKGRKLQLNASGEVLLSSVKIIIDELNIIEGRFLYHDENYQRPILIASDAVDVADEAAKLFSLLHPEIPIQVQRYDRCRSSENEIRLSAQFVISLEPFIGTGVRSELLFNEPMYLVCSQNAKRFKEKSVSLSELQGCTLITGNTDSAIGKLFDSYFDTALVRPEKRIAITDSEVLLTSAARGVGISFMPKSCYLYQVKNYSDGIFYKFSAFPVQEAFCSRNVYFAGLKSSVSPQAALFQSFLLAYAGYIKKFGFFPNYDEYIRYCSDDAVFPGSGEQVQ